jgi:WD40 repeat protein
VKKLYVTLLLVFLAVGVAAFIFWRYFFLATIAIDPIPTDATISVNGKPVISRTLKLPKGTYTIEVKSDGYRTESFTATVGIGSNVSKRIELVSLPKPTKLADGPFDSFAIAADGKTFFFEQNDTLYFYSLTVPQPAPLVPITPKIEGISAIDWSPDFSLALLRKASGEIGLYDFKRYDLLHQEYRPLAATIKDTAWLADGSGFFYQNKDSATGENTISKADRTGAGPTRLFDLNAVSFPIATPELTTGATTTVLLSNPDTKVDSDIYLFDSFQKTPPAPLTESGRIAGPVFSTDKARLAYTDNGELVVSDATGKNKRNLAIRPKADNYSFIDADHLMVLTPNLVTIVDLTSATTEPTTYEVYAPDDAVSHVTATPDGKTIYYIYQNTLYQIIIK